VFSDRMGVDPLACFDRDVLSHPHTDTVILMIGINDIGWPGCILAPQEPAPSADAIIPTGSKMDNPNGIYHSIVRPGCRLH
jgi:lysophospholipase L1-like esterase